MLLGAAVLVAAAWLRGAEYDEQYTLFLTAGTARPVWPDGVFLAGDVSSVQSGHATFASIAMDLRATDVHPPLYVWAVALWRDAFGPGLFAARLFSVLCGLVSLALTGAIAGRCGINRSAAMLLALGCYGFAYTNAIARGFAPAETFTLAGAALLLARRHGWAGAAFGAACGCNYLAVFVGCAACGTARAWRALPAALPFLAMDAWFFAAQHGARPGQFPPFALWPSAVRLAGYQAAAVFGGLPLYFDGPWRIAAGACVGLGVLVIGMRMLRAYRHRLLLAAALAPPIGLLSLGAAFNNTPIELRYLSFGLPFVALLAASRSGSAVVTALQAAGIAGLLLSPRTMQPAGAAAAEAAAFADGGIVLVPAGNDGVGIVGAFAIESPPAVRLMVVRAHGPLVSVPPGCRRVVLALLAQDRDSTAVLPIMRAVVGGPNWRRVAIGSKVEAYEREE
jgi:hypothetical protein